MNYPLLSSGQVQAAAGLAEAVADRYGCVGIISQSAVGTAALLDQTAQELSSRGIRCVRVQGPASGGLASRDLIAQIVARPGPGVLTDADLEAGFKALTEPGEGFRRVALLVSEAHSLLPSALRYVQLARQASPARLCVVLAGKPGLAAALEGEDFIPLRSAMHMMELSEPAGASLFDQASALPELPPQVRAGRSSPLVRLGLAACIIPIVGLIWWRHLPAVPEAVVQPQDAPSVPANIDAPSGSAAAAAPRAPPAASPPAVPPPAVASAESAREPAPPELAPPEPAPPEPSPPASPQAGPAPDPAPPVAAVTVPEPPASDAPAKPDAPAERSAGTAEPPALESPAAAAEPTAPAPIPTIEPPAAVAAEPPAAPPERGEAPAQETDLADTPAPKPAASAPDAGPPAPEPAIATKPPAPPPYGTLTVTTAPPVHGGARRAAAPVAAPQAAVPPARPAEDRPNLADEKRCREIVFRAQLGKDPSDADKQFLRSGCRG